MKVSAISPAGDEEIDNVLNNSKLAVAIGCKLVVYKLLYTLASDGIISSYVMLVHMLVREPPVEIPASAILTELPNNTD